MTQIRLTLITVLMALALTANLLANGAVFKDVERIVTIGDCGQFIRALKAGSARHAIAGSLNHYRTAQTLLR